jgi:ribose transport system permease protein
MDAARAEQGEAVADVSATPAARRPGLGSSVLPFTSKYAVIGVWVLMIVIFWAAKPGVFMTSGTFLSIFNTQYGLVFMTMALLCTIVIGEFVDLSVPAVFGLAATLFPVLVANHHWGLWPAAIVAALAAVACGAINGLLVVVAGVNTIVVTLGMSTLLMGIAEWMSAENTVNVPPGGTFSKLTLGSIGGVYVSFIYCAALVLVFAYVLGFTPLGRHMRFVGANREVSRLSGIRVNRIRFGSYVAAGAFSGVGAIVYIAGIGGFTASTSNTQLLPVFAAVFLGTAVIAPGRFNPIGTWIGIYFMQTGITGFQDLGLATWISDVFYGGVLVAAVTISTLLHRRTR